jgi:hypothetical protein
MRRAHSPRGDISAKLNPFLIEPDDISSILVMETHHSMKNESSIVWYLDSEPDEQETKNASTKTVHARQPWRSYWPPRCRKMREVWLRSEFPEVLSWRFDRTQPFDRPWRTWTKSAHAMEEQAVMLIRRQPVERLGGNSSKISTLASNLNIYCC